MSNMTRRGFAAAALATPVVLGSARASTQPVKMIVVVPPGASMDSIVRTVAEKMPALIGREVMVDYRVGGTGLAAATYLKSTDPDGSNIVFAPIAIQAYYPFLYSSLPYDPDRDLLPVSEGAFAANALVANKGLGVADLNEYIAAVKKDPRLGSIGTSGLAGVGGFVVHLLRKLTGAELQLVAYRGGQPLLTDLLGNHIPAGQSVLSDYLEPHKGGLIKVLGVTPAKRSRLAPDIPTIAEQGFPTLTGQTSLGFFVRGGTPRDLVERYSAALRQALAMPDVITRLEGLGVEATGTTPEGLADIIRTDRARWEPVAREAGIRLN
jgi:tripartite-type tricarboxylate transporter receptor subunit TctC